MGGGGGKVKNIGGPRGPNSQNEVRRFSQNYWRVWVVPEKNLLSTVAACPALGNADNGAGVYT